MDGVGKRDLLLYQGRVPECVGRGDGSLSLLKTLPVGVQLQREREREWGKK